MMRIVFFLMQVAAFIVLLRLIYFFYKSLQKPTEKKASKKTATTTCPSPATLIDYTKGKIKGRQKQELYDHIADCKDCQYAVRSIFDMPTEEKLKDEKAPN